MKYLFLLCTALFLVSPHPVYAASSPSDFSSYISNTLTIIILLATSATTFFLIKGGYLYITSSGSPESLIKAKKTIKQALLGLLLVLASGSIVTLLTQAFDAPSTQTIETPFSLTAIEASYTETTLAKLLIDTTISILQNLAISATKPLIDGIFSFLTSTPSLLHNAVIFKFWIIMVGITDALFVLIIALLGLQMITTSDLGYEELTFSQLLPRIGLCFLGANTSLFLADYVIVTCNAVTQAVISQTGGLQKAWLLQALNPETLLSTASTALITPLFFIIFLIVSIVLLIFYITRLITVVTAAVLSPFVFLLLTLPKFQDFATLAIKGYIATVFTVFIHVVIIQLASSFLTLPQQQANPLLSLAVGTGLFLTLLKTPSFVLQLVVYSSTKGMVKTIGNHITNAITSKQSPSHYSSTYNPPMRRLQGAYR